MVAADLVRLMDNWVTRRSPPSGMIAAPTSRCAWHSIIPSGRRLVVIDGVPISEALARCDATFAHDWYHWFFFAQPDTPERVITADPDAWYGQGAPRAMGAENYQEFRQAIHDPATVRAMLEDYRAGLGVDREHEEADRRAGRTVRCPTLFLWSTRDDMEDLYGDPLAVWRLGPTIYAATRSSPDITSPRRTPTT